MKTQKELMNLAKETIRQAIGENTEKLLNNNIQGLLNDEKTLVTNYVFALIKVLNEVFTDKFILTEREKNDENA